MYGKASPASQLYAPSPLLFGGSGAFPALQGLGGDMLDVELDLDGQIMGVPEPPPPNVDHIPRPSQPH